MLPDTYQSMDTHANTPKTSLDTSKHPQGTQNTLTSLPGKAGYFQAFSVAHTRKLDKSWEACHRQGIVFLPLAVESLGAWHPSAIAEVKKLGSALARHTGEEETTTTSRLFQRLSICLMRGNAALFNNRCPPDQSVRGDEIEW